MLVKRCPITGKNFEITDSELAHIERMGRMHPSIQEPLPLPTLHPYELLRRLYCFGNLMFLYSAKSALSGTPQLCRYNPADGYKICTLEEFWSDRVDNSQFGSDYDFRRPFFEQWHDLSKRVYLPPLNNRNTEGSDYVNGTVNIRNCYLCFDTLESQDCIYCLIHLNGNDDVDCVGTIGSQFCYSCIDISKCYECEHCQDCQSCAECFGSLDCVGCRNCVGCVGLRNCEFHIFNQAVTREEYRRFLGETGLETRAGRSKLLSECEHFQRSSGHAVTRIRNSEECSGCYILNSKNLLDCYHADNSRDCGHLLLAYNSRDCWRGYSFNGELSYQSGSTSSRASYYSYSDFTGENNIYCYLMFNHNVHCFGCVGLKGKSYCILNKQYTQSEYFELLPRIIQHMKVIGEWGNYFPPSVAPHPYNESIGAYLIQDLPTETLLSRGYRLSPAQAVSNYAGALRADELPDSVDAVAANALIKRPVICSKTGRPFNFQARELQFYEKQSIPLPQMHWRERLFAMAGRRQLIPAI